MLLFKVINNFDALKGNVARGMEIPTRAFRAGDDVTGYEHPDYPGVAVIEEEWIMPASNLTLMGEFENGKAAPAVIELPAEFQAELDRIKKADFVKDVMNKSRSSMSWMFAGGLIGFFFALMTKNNVLFSTLIGGMTFGLIGYNVKMPAMNIDLVSQANKPTEQ